MHVRRKLVAGNWKMNGSLHQLTELGAIAAAARAASGVDVAICPPFTLIASAVARGGGIPIGGQDCHHQSSGAFTGNVSATMLKEAGAKLVIVGHSERRAEQQESDAIVRAKAQAALAAGLQTIVCIGESEEERMGGHAITRCSAQLAGSIPELSGDAELVVAYEPIWAIGTGRTATCDDVREIHGLVRKVLVDRFGDAGGRIRILYGGSVRGDNAAELFAVDNVDGALVGGASLNAEQFVPIIEAAAQS
ncbi:triose-phosphate isomerase [Allosphingosinicella deserti]|uniref:Triosephosphate isomerase n=1 Tax=Allosphingosinicella deserti TaxID=2116704 RepID=A0A2P7QPD5_9SPHN|nr:triose-phosphate isomerase [Sphingomonas deserti]PSJ39808.1 triose-phosphate isomerase [Sphingomonas deserti]